MQIFTKEKAPDLVEANNFQHNRILNLEEAVGSWNLMSTFFKEKKLESKEGKITYSASPKCLVTNLKQVSSEIC